MIDKGISLVGANRENTIDAGGVGSTLTFANGSGGNASLSGFTHKMVEELMYRIGQMDIVSGLL